MDAPGVHEPVALKPSSDSFYFPYPTPYAIQQDLMTHLYDALGRAQVTVVESPTGTGKSLSLISAACTFLRDFGAQARNEYEARLRAQAQGAASSSGEPQWVIENDVKVKLEQWDKRERELEERIERIRQAERIAAEGGARAKKRQKVSHGSGGQVTAEDFAPDVDADAVPDENTDPTSNLSSTVKDLMRKFEASRGGHTQEDDDEVDVRKIFYTSRTHSQLSQFIAELRKTRFGSDSADRPLRVIPLGSRQNLCINDDVRKKAGNSNDALGDLCKDLQKQSGDARCQYLPPADEPSRMNAFRDKALAKVRDIEDIEDLGRKSKVCPYYGSRKALKSAELVTLPYNMLMSKTTREAMGISLSGHLVLIDEAHNLIDTILSMHSVSMTTTTLRVLLHALTTYIHKFSARLKGINAVTLEKLRRYMAGLEKFALEWADEKTGWTKYGKKDALLTVNDVLGQAKGSLDQINVTELDQYLQETKIARKIGGYIEFCEDAATAQGRKVARSDATRNFHRLQAFLMCLANPDRDGRILLSAERTASSKTGEAASKSIVTLKYMLLAPGDAFRSVVEEARAVVLAGGTMAPISDFREQLVPYLGPERFSTFSCGHIVPKENVATFALSKGPTGGLLEFKFDNRKDQRITDDVGQAISNMCNIVPKGVVVFVPSYAFLDTVKARWTDSGLLARLERRKKVFWEPKTSAEVEPTLRAYQGVIRDGARGAILFAVFGAKLSEGINFADDMARLVVVVGIPYPNSQSTELKERMNYLNATSRQLNGVNPGQVLYTNLAFRAVNQSIGRAIRHANDWAAIVLIDARYAQKSKQAQLPRWLGEQIETPDSFGGLVKSLAAFYKRRTAAAGASAPV